MNNFNSSTEHLLSFYLLLFWGNGLDMSEISESSRAISEQLALGFFSCCPHLPSGLPHQRCLVSKRQLAEEDGPSPSLREPQRSRIPLHVRATWFRIILLLSFHFLFCHLDSLALGFICT